MTDELTLDLEVGDATWAALADRYEPGELVELVLTAAFYSCVSRVLRTLRLPVDPTDPRLGPEWARAADRSRLGSSRRAQTRSVTVRLERRYSSPPSRSRE